MSQLPINAFTHQLSTKKQIGLWISLASNFSADIIAPTGYDWVLIDMEHSPNEISSVLGQLQSFKSSSSTALVRPSSNDPVLVKRLLDLGAEGLIFPMIQSVEEAKQAVASTRYPPNGIRGVSGCTRANNFGRIKNYFDEIEKEIPVILQLETIEALNIAEDIANVDGVSGIFFGPADISADLGLKCQPMHSKVWDAILPIADKLIAKNIPVGTLVFDPDFVVSLFKRGFSFVACGSDASLLAKSSDHLFNAIKAQIGHN